MAGTTSPYGFPYPTAGDPYTDPAGDIQNLAEAFDTVIQQFLDSAEEAARPPMALASGGAGQVSTNSTVAQALTTVTFDNDGLTTNLAANRFEMVVQSAGIYAVWGSVVFPSSTVTTVNHGVGIFVNGVISVAHPTAARTVANNTVGGWRSQVGTLAQLSVGDRVAVGVYFSIPTVFAVANITASSLGMVRVST